jgi:hypothetical protein
MGKDKKPAPAKADKAAESGQAGKDTGKLKAANHVKVFLYYVVCV